MKSAQCFSSMRYAGDGHALQALHAESSIRTADQKDHQTANCQRCCMPNGTTQASGNSMNAGNQHRCVAEIAQTLLAQWQEPMAPGLRRLTLLHTCKLANASDIIALEDSCCATWTCACHLILQCVVPWTVSHKLVKLEPELIPDDVA